MALGAAGPTFQLLLVLSGLLLPPFLPVVWTGSPHSSDVQKGQRHLLQWCDYAERKCRGERMFTECRLRKGKEKLLGVLPHLPDPLNGCSKVLHFGSTIPSPCPQPPPEEALKSLFSLQIPEAGHLCHSCQLSSLFFKHSTHRGFTAGYFMHYFHLFAPI